MARRRQMRRNKGPSALSPAAAVVDSSAQTHDHHIDPAPPLVPTPPTHSSLSFEVVAHLSNGIRSDAAAFRGLDTPLAPNTSTPTIFPVTQPTPSSPWWIPHILDLPLLDSTEAFRIPLPTSSPTLFHGDHTSMAFDAWPNTSEPITFHGACDSTFNAGTPAPVGAVAGILPSIPLSEAIMPHTSYTAHVSGSLHAAAQQGPRVTRSSTYPASDACRSIAPQIAFHTAPPCPAVEETILEDHSMTTMLSGPSSIRVPELTLVHRTEGSPVYETLAAYPAAHEGLEWFTALSAVSS